MTVTLHSTDRIVTLVTGAGEIQARLWEGHTEQGVACHAFVTRIAVANHLDHSAFVRELQEQHAPVSADLQGVYPARLVI